MLQRQFECLIALDRERDALQAAARCGLSVRELVQELKQAEVTYGRPLVQWGEGHVGFVRFTSIGEVALACARRLLETEGPAGEADPVPVPVPDGGAARPADAAPDPAGDEQALLPLLARRSVSPRRLQAPAPSAAQLDLMVQAALRAPDHGAQLPWRLIEFGPESRHALADLFEDEKRRRDPLAPEADLRRARAHATRAPMLLGFVMSPRHRSPVPLREQWLAAGAALGNLLNAAHQLGFGAIVLSGERCFDGELTRRLGVRVDEYLAGFISLGRVAEAPPRRRAVPTRVVWSRWSPCRCSDGDAIAAGPAVQRKDGSSNPR